MEVGSDKLNRRSWTHDSELSCAILDRELDGRSPVDPVGTIEPARRLARDARLRLWREHLGRRIGAGDHDDVDLIDFVSTSLRSGPRLRRLTTGVRAAGSDLVHRLVVDPDCRPREERQRNAV